MGVKEKLGKLVNIISTSSGSLNQLDEIVWDLLKDINDNNLDYIKYYSTKIKLEYNDFINVWDNFTKKNILDINNENTFELDKSSLMISLFENELSVDLEDLFNLHINCMEDDLLLFYIKDENKILLMYKSYIPLINAIEPRLPFWEYIMEHPKIKEKFDELFEPNKNLCIIGFSI